MISGSSLSIMDQVPSERASSPEILKLWSLDKSGGDSSAAGGFWRKLIFDLWQDW
jgi:hypothetical protein